MSAPTDRIAHDDHGFAQSRWDGDRLYMSGVIVTREPGEGRDGAALRQQLRRAFERIAETLRAAGSDFSRVIMIRSYHVWDSPDFEGDRFEQFAAFNDVKREFMRAPWPAWTAVGTTGLLAPGGIVEIELVARVPVRTCAERGAGL
ncbi:Rid family hydrolase [Sphingomonas colocasiae]|uniref:RidA family protein n=1 Tax=Sphingomonas colocasiae TaxID=1848973 RepID=A0ABS7PQK9_9SPHN|nr:Rid family hydrolase [Sphingomonas colocasiae]MBY8823558.1 hypothetical protein [Sphingomonas colocasiae]